jgi:hypothetical protein
MKLWYMRDNHTFRALPPDDEEAIAVLRVEFDRGFTSGMLCATSPLHPFRPDNVHAHADFAEFEPRARAWLATARTYSSPGELEYASWRPPAAPVVDSKPTDGAMGESASNRMTETEIHAHSWWCPHCRVDVPPEMVTKDGEHYLESGGCGRPVRGELLDGLASVDSKPAPAEGVGASELPWDASQIKQPGWHHVEAAFIDGAREARANPEADEVLFSRAADGYTKRVFEEVDPVSEAALRTGSWKAAAVSPVSPVSDAGEGKP